MKSIMISIKPEWVEKILNGEKTIEIRKTMPKCKLPCKVYIYCSKGKYGLTRCMMTEKDKIKGKWTYQRRIIGYLNGEPLTTFGQIDSKVVAEFTLNNVEKIIYLTDRESVKKHGCWECKLEDAWKIKYGLSKSKFNPEDYSNYYTEGSDDNYLIFCSGLTGTELHNYLKGRTGYVWRIDDLKIYDKPKELSDFLTQGYENYDDWLLFNDGTQNYNAYLDGWRLRKAPQSWCYIEEEMK